MKYNLIFAIIWFVFSIFAFMAGVNDWNQPTWSMVGWAWLIIAFDFLDKYFNDDWRN